MTPTTQQKLFDAFYTTKGIGGTGLGLWISREIIDRHHGRMSVYSSDHSERSGSVFRVFLPFASHAPVTLASGLSPSADMAATR